MQRGKIYIKMKTKEMNKGEIMKMINKHNQLVKDLNKKYKGKEKDLYMYMKEGII